MRYIEGSRNYQLIYMDDKREPLEVKMTMNRLEQLTEPLGFIRVHKGYLANCRFIQHISASEVVLVDGVTIPIGRSKAGEVKVKYLTLIGKH